MSAATCFDSAFRQTLVRYARRRVPAGEVEDVVQEALCDVLGSDAPTTRPEMLRWSLAILRRRIVDLYRARTRMSYEPLDGALAEAAGAQHALPRIEARDCLRRLDFTHEAMALILAESAGDSLAVAARAQGISAEAARQRVSRHRRYRSAVRRSATRGARAAPAPSRVSPLGRAHDADLRARRPRLPELRGQACACSP